MKSYPIIMQDFSIAGIKKQYDWQQKVAEWEKAGSHTVKYQEGQIKSPVEILQKGAEQFTNIGCKTETRRLTGLKRFNENPDRFRYVGDSTTMDIPRPAIKYDDRVYHLFNYSNSNEVYHVITCPYGKKGDELWVRETWGREYNGKETPFLYKASVNPTSFQDRATKWKSPLFMPKKASRITLINEGVTVERLHNINTEGAMREGFSFRDFAEGDTTPEARTPSGLYRDTWIKMHGQESWDSSPYVWVLKFSVKEVKQ